MFLSLNNIGDQPQRLKNTQKSRLWRNNKRIMHVTKRDGADATNHHKLSSATKEIEPGQTLRETTSRPVWIELEIDLFREHSYIFFFLP